MPQYKSRYLENLLESVFSFHLVRSPRGLNSLYWLRHLNSLYVCFETESLELKLAWNLLCSLGCPKFIAFFPSWPLQWLDVLNELPYLALREVLSKPRKLCEPYCASENDNIYTSQRWHKCVRVYVYCHICVNRTNVHY